MLGLFNGWWFGLVVTFWSLSSCQQSYSTLGHWARLVLGWVTVSVIQLPLWEICLSTVYNQPARSAHHGHCSVGRSMSTS